jgi:signal transduction histidine kinase/ligand-binding sensor domain-containing protein
MTSLKHQLSKLTIFCLLAEVFAACNNSNNIPFPDKELGYSPPLTVPLVFSNTKKLIWDTARKGGITPVIKKLDIDALPAFPYDSTGFKSFSEAPEEVHFNFDSLPEKDFNPDKLSSHPLDFKTTALGPIPSVKTGLPIMQKGRPLSIYDFGKAQGLQASLITTLLRSHDGLLWIGSSEGLFRYDGDHIQTFIQGSSSDGPYIGITEDHNGNIWFIKGGATLGMINIHKNTISLSNKIRYNIRGLYKMITDKAGNIWVYNLTDKAVSIINPDTQSYKNIDGKTWLSDSTGFKSHNFPNDLQILQDDSKNIWITTMAGGVDIIDATSGKIKYLRKDNGLSSDSITAIAEDKNGQIWVGTQDGGVDAVDIKNGTIKHYGKLQGFKNDSTTSLYFDNKGFLWRNTFSGIELADLKNEKIRYIDQSNGLSGNVMLSAVEDSYHRMWVSSSTGLNMITQNGETVHPLGTTQIVSLMEDGANNLWVATTNGLFIVNPQRTAMHLLDKSGGLSDNFVQSFWNKNGNIIVATDGGYNIIDPVHKTLLKAGKKEGLVNDTIYVAFNDDSGNMWLTGPSKGIFLIDSARKLILHTDVSGGLNDDAIFDIKQDKSGLIWLATQHSGIDVVNPAEGTVKYLNSQPGLMDTCNRMLLEDSYGRMWIGTDRGIYVADTKKGTLTNITTKQGLTTNTILSLLEYNGTIIANTNNKISLITAPEPGDSATDWKISLLNKSQGLLKEEANSWSTDAVTHDGKYLWGDLGLTIINQIKPDNDSVATYITGMSVMGQPQYFLNTPSDTVYSGQAKLEWDSVSGPYNLPINLSLPHNENYLQFQFAQANLSRPDTTFYTYVLEGIDKNWSTPTINPFTENYLNLPPGHYKFKVSSKGINGIWSQPAEFRFSITPPWYQTWWAYTIFALIGIGLLRLYIVYRSRKLQKENKILEEKVTHRTAQLKKSLDDLRSTQAQLVQQEKMASLGELTAGIAHEIQNPLNFVNNFSEVNMELTDELKDGLQKIRLTPEEKNNLEKIAEDIRQNQEKINFHGKRADSIVKGMLQHSRASSGRKEPTDINALCDEYLRLSYHGLRAKDKSFNAKMETEFDPNLPKLNIMSQEVGRVILNLINNAFYAVTDKKKSSGPDYQPTVTVSTNQADGRVDICVKDNGTGIPSRVLDKIFQPFFTTKPTGQGTGLGLSLSYDIIKANGGEIKVETKEGEGTKFIIELPKNSA